MYSIIICFSHILIDNSNNACDWIIESFIEVNIQLVQHSLLVRSFYITYMYVMFVRVAMDYAWSLVVYKLPYKSD